MSDAKCEQIAVNIASLNSMFVDCEKRGYYVLLVCILAARCDEGVKLGMLMVVVICHRCCGDISVAGLVGVMQHKVSRTQPCHLV